MAGDPTKIAVTGPVSKVNLALLEANVSGISPNGSTIGVAGQSVSNDGVWGSSSTGKGVEGTSASGPGVSGSSQNGPGVSGTSNSGNGVTATSTSSNGIHAKGNPAGLFDGDVMVNGSMRVLTALSAATFETPGGVIAASITTSGAISAGSVMTSGNVTANDVMLTGADLAEDFFTGVESPIEPGTVLVINDGGSLGESKTAYDRRVAGVVSGAGAFRPGIVMDRGRIDAESRVPIALVGKVYCKVDASYGPIQVGDLLTTSPTPGHAMKVSDESRAFGAVIGKALAQLGSGTSLVPILVALQ